MLLGAAVCWVFGEQGKVRPPGCRGGWPRRHSQCAWHQSAHPQEDAGHVEFGNDTTLGGGVGGWGEGAFCAKLVMCVCAWGVCVAVCVGVCSSHTHAIHVAQPSHL